MNRYSMTLVALTMALCSRDVEARFASIKAAGMGDVGVAYPQDSLAAAYNPAGITDVSDTIDVNAALAHLKSSVTIRGNQGLQNFLHTLGTQPLPVNGKFSGSTRHKNVPAVSGGVTMKLQHNITIGFATWGGNFAKATGKPNPLVGSTAPPAGSLIPGKAKKIGIEYESVFAGPTIAAKWEQFSLGAQVLFAVQRINQQGLAAFTNPLFTAHPHLVTNKGYSYSWGVGYALGIKWNPRHWLSLGFTFSPKIHCSRFKKYQGLNPQRSRLNQPMRIAGGIALHPMKNFNLAFDVEYHDTSGVHFLRNNIASNGIANKLGTNHGTGYGFKRRIIFGLGADWRICDQLQVRAGYQHFNHVVRSTQTFFNVGTLPAVVSDFVMCGATWNPTFMKKLRATVFYSHGFKRKVRGRNSIPHQIIPVPGLGLFDVVGGGNFDLSSRIDAAGIGFGYDY